MNNFDRFDEANRHLENNDLAKAAEVYEAILREGEDELSEFTASKNLGFIFYELKKYEAAQEQLSHALNLPFEDENGRINRILGFIYSLTKQFDIAAEYLEQSIFLQEEKDHEYYICLYELGKVLFEIDEHKMAFKHLSEAESFFKEKHRAYYASSLYYLGLIRFVQKELEVSRSYFEQIISLSEIPDSLKINGFYGLLFIENTEKNGDKMIALAGKILEINPNFYDKETLVFFTLKAYQYQSRELEYEHMLELFMSDYPEGKYSDQYDELKNYEFKPYIK